MMRDLLVAVQEGNLSVREVLVQEVPDSDPEAAVTEVARVRPLVMCSEVDSVVAEVAREVAKEVATEVLQETAQLPVTEVQRAADQDTTIRRKLTTADLLLNREDMDAAARVLETAVATTMINSSRTLMVPPGPDLSNNSSQEETWATVARVEDTEMTMVMTSTMIDLCPADSNLPQETLPDSSSCTTEITMRHQPTPEVAEVASAAEEVVLVALPELGSVAAEAGTHVVERDKRDIDKVC